MTAGRRVARLQVPWPIDYPFAPRWEPNVTDTSSEARRKAAETTARRAARTAARGYGQPGQTGEGWELSHDLTPTPIHRPVLAEAARLYAEAIGIHPTGVNHWRRALILMQLGEFDEAIAAFRACVDCGDYVDGKAADPQIAICRQLQARGGRPGAEGDLRADIAMQATARMLRDLPGGDAATSIFSRMMAALGNLPGVAVGTREGGSSAAAPRPPLTEAESTAVCDFGEGFAWRLVRGDWEGAHAQLDRRLRAELSPEDLREQYLEMTEYFEAPVDEVEAQPPDSHMPDMDDDEVAWVYVAIASSYESEAVMLMVRREAGALRVSSLEWGRP